MKTVSLSDQMKASMEIYDRTMGLISGSDLASAMGRMSGSDIDRALARMSDSDIASALGRMSDSDLARTMVCMSGSDLARTMGLMSDSDLASTMGRMSDIDLARTNKFMAIEIPVVENLDKLIAEAAEAGNLDMTSWHCGTTHCRAGWAIVFGGEEGKKLEEVFGSEMAGRLIYEASTGRVAPDFFARNKEAIEDIRRCAKEAEKK